MEGSVACPGIDFQWRFPETYWNRWLGRMEEISGGIPATSPPIFLLRVKEN